MKIWALVPVKDTTLAKQRLAGLLAQSHRQGLALAMAEDVLTALSSTEGLDGIAVASVDPIVQAMARRHGARIIIEGAMDGHTKAVATASRVLAESGATSVLTLPIDVPLATPSEIQTVLAAHDWGSPAFTIVPSHDLLGSNCILRSPVDCVPVRFGEESFYPHLKAARDLGIEPTVVELQGIGSDIDHPRDVEVFLKTKSHTHTRRFLLELGLLEIPS